MNNANEMILAVQAGDVSRMRTLLEQDSSLAGGRDAQGVSAIMHALYRRQSEALKLLLENNPRLDIFEAAATGKGERIDALVQEDPSLVHAYSADGFTPLHFACYFAEGRRLRNCWNEERDVAAVSRNPMHLMPLHSAASARNTKAAQALLERGADVNAKQEKGWAALHAAAQNGDQATADILLKHGADPHLANEDGVTAAELGKKSGLKFG